MKSEHLFALFVCGLAVMTLLVPGCATSGRSGDGIIMIGESGENRPVTPEEIDALCGVDSPYYLQVGDVVNVDFAIRSIRSDEVPWDYKIEVGDSMEVRLGPRPVEPGEYRLDTGDVIGISFLDNWQMNVTRTIRPDGMITAPEVGDVNAGGLTPLELRDALKEVYAASGLIEGEPRITVNVDFVNLDRYESMSRDVIVRPDGAITLPGVEESMRIAGLTVAEATDLVEVQAAKVLRNRPQAALLVFPAVDTNVLSTMSGAVQIRPDGKLSVARLGDVPAAGYSIEELKHSLAGLCAPISSNPVEVSADVLKATGGRIYVGGEVNQPGVYPLEGAPSALQAVMMANGLKDTSRLNNVIVLRRNPNGKPFVFNTNLRVALTRGHTDNDILLRPFDTVYIPKKTVSKLNLFVDQYINEMVPFDNSMGISATYYANEQQVDSKSKNINFSTGLTGIADVLNP